MARFDDADELYKSLVPLWQSTQLPSERSISWHPPVSSHNNLPTLRVDCRNSNIDASFTDVIDVASRAARDRNVNITLNCDGAKFGRSNALSSSTYRPLPSPPSPPPRPSYTPTYTPTYTSTCSSYGSSSGGFFATLRRRLLVLFKIFAIIVGVLVLLWFGLLVLVFAIECS